MALSDGRETKVEAAKRGSRFLRGSVTESLGDGTAGFGHDDAQVLKFHGIYQQIDRDARPVARVLGNGKEHWFMVRVKVPAGVLGASQYLALDELASRHSYNRSLRITTRQGIQLHGVLKGRLRETIRGIDETILSTLAACGDVERNVMAPPPLGDTPGIEVARQLAARIAAELCPATGAYHEIWLDGERVASADEEPLYGPAYLPRKFKTAVTVPPDDSVEIRSQDVGLVAFVEGDELTGVDVLVGGGLGLNHRKAGTFARLASPLGYVAAGDAVAVVRAVVELFREHGNRTDRMHARLKYLIEDWGMERFRRELLSRADFELMSWRELPELRAPDHLGAHACEDGSFHYGIPVPSGRIIDTDGRRLKTALRRIVEALHPRIVLTPRQDLVLDGLTGEECEKVEAVLRAYGVSLHAELSPLRRRALACPAMPTCGLALAESERLMPRFLAELEPHLEKLGLAGEDLDVRMTGCPNGCARPYTGDIGVVGRRPGVYDIFVAGSAARGRLADRYAREVPTEELVPTLLPLLRQWRRGCRPGEGLGEFYLRHQGRGTGKRILTGTEEAVLSERSDARPGPAP